MNKVLCCSFDKAYCWCWAGGRESEGEERKEKCAIAQCLSRLVHNEFSEICHRITHFIYLVENFPWIDNLNISSSRFVCSFSYTFSTFFLSLQMCVFFSNAINFARFSKLELINVRLLGNITLLACAEPAGQNGF